MVIQATAILMGPSMGVDAGCQLVPEASCCIEAAPSMPAMPDPGFESPDRSMPSMGMSMAIPA